MKKSEIITLAANLAEQATAGTEIDLVDVEYVKESGRYFCGCISTSRAASQSMTAIRSMSAWMSFLIKQILLITHTYWKFSPGLDRPLKKPADFVRNIGRRISVRTYQPLDGQKQFVGRLTAVENGIVRLDLGAGEIEVPQDQIAKARLVVDF